MDKGLLDFYKNIAEKLMNEIDKDDLYYNDDFNYDNIDISADRVIPFNYYSADGATRYVIVPENTVKDEIGNYVIKIPFLGSKLYSWNDDEEDYNYDDLTYFYFNGGINGNYCEEEYQIYHRAIEINLSCFCETLKIRDDFYLQEKAIVTDEFTPNKHSNEEKNSALIITSNSRKLNCFDLDWIADFINYYGMDKLRKLDRFMQDNHIGDMHGSNYGYSLRDNRPVLIDFATYRD